jgi:hypothetical protein
VVYGKPSHNHSGYLYRSVDGGLNWQDIGPAGKSPRAWWYRAQDRYRRICAGSSTNRHHVRYIAAIRHLQSTDGAQSWHESNFGLTSLYVQTLLMSPHDHHELYAGTTAGVFKSTDSGETWKIVLDKGRTRYALAADPLEPGTVYVAPSADGIFKSRDVGDTWITLTAGLGTPVIDLILDLQDPRTIYAGGLDSGQFRISDGNSSSRGGSAGSTYGLCGDTRIIHVEEH